MVCQGKIVCTECLANYKVHDVWKVSDIPLKYSSLADQIEENHTSALSNTEAQFSRVKTCIESIKSRVAVFENDMDRLFASVLRSQNSIRAESEACISSQLRHIECMLSQSLTIPLNAMKSCRDIGIKYGLSNNTSWHILHSPLIEQTVDLSSTISFPTVSLGQAARLHCELEPCPKWNGFAGSEFSFMVRVRDKQGRKLSPLDSILTQIKAESREIPGCSFNIVTTENSDAFVKFNVALPIERVFVVVTVNNLYSLVTPPIKFSAMPIVFPTSVWAKASNSIFFISGHAAASYQNKIYVSGGISDGKLVDVGSVFNSLCLDWVDTLTMSAPRVRHGMVESNGFLWMMGGFSDDSQKKILGSMEKYVFARRIWEVAPAMPVSAADFVAIAHKGSIYIIGGSALPTAALIFNCASSRWDTLPCKMR